MLNKRPSILLRSSVSLYLLLGLLQLLLQLHQSGFQLIDPSQDSNPLVHQVTQLQAARAARAGRVLVLQEPR